MRALVARHARTSGPCSPIARAATAASTVATGSRQRTSPSRTSPIPAASCAATRSATSRSTAASRLGRRRGRRSVRRPGSGAARRPRASRTWHGIVPAGWPGSREGVSPRRRGPCSRAARRTRRGPRSPATRIAIVPAPPKTGTVVPGTGPGRSHIDRRVGTPVGASRTPSQRPVTSPPMCAQLSTVPAIANPMIRFRITSATSWPIRPRDARSSTGRWTYWAAIRIPNRPKIAPEAPTANCDSGDGAERERRQRPAGRRHEVQPEERPPPVQPLDDRPGEVQRVHVEDQVERHLRSAARGRASPTTAGTARPPPPRPCRARGSGTGRAARAG